MFPLLQLHQQPSQSRDRLNSDCANITCNLTIIINIINHYNRSGHSILGRPGASASEYSGRNTQKVLLRRKIFCLMELITKLTLTITLKPCASAAEYTTTSTRTNTSAAENICPMSLMTKLTLILNDPYDDV